ncbi:MAG: nucleoside-triphosphatase [Methanomicrobiaceae archaeon]|nr:nucleoside-triphosphatase [Methanomicrobiaceae archaeon]
MPPNNVLLTGIPGVGKTTVIRRLAEILHPVRPAGFYTEEIRDGGLRVGFLLVSLDGPREILAHTAIQRKEQVGKYGVDIEGFERFLEGILFFEPGRGICIIDEIGKMECFSEQFRELVPLILESRVPCVATIALKGTPFIQSVKERDDVVLVEMTRENRNQCANRILRLLSPDDRSPFE